MRATLVAACIFCATYSSQALACSCTNFDAQPADFVKDADVVFFGTAISAELDAGESDVDALDNGSARFRSVRSIKGVNDGEVVNARFLASGTSCDLPVAVGQDYFYFLYRANDQLLYPLCGQPNVFSDKLDEFLDSFEAESGSKFDEFRRFIRKGDDE